MSSCFYNSQKIVAQVIGSGVLAFAGVSAIAQGMGPGIMSPPANVRPPGLKNVGIAQHLNQQLPLGLSFRDESGKSIQ